ncbi:MAG: hypothetical protein WBA93_36910 [Microcoleaceae cyanobacterium]
MSAPFASTAIIPIGLKKPGYKFLGVGAISEGMLRKHEFPLLLLFDQIGLTKSLKPD